VDSEVQRRCDHPRRLQQAFGPALGLAAAAAAAAALEPAGAVLAAVGVPIAREAGERQLCWRPRRKPAQITS